MAISTSKTGQLGRKILFMHHTTLYDSLTIWGFLSYFKTDLAVIARTKIEWCLSAYCLDGGQFDRW